MIKYCTFHLGRELRLQCIVSAVTSVPEIVQIVYQQHTGLITDCLFEYIPQDFTVL